MNEDSQNENSPEVTEDLPILEFLQQTLGCTYISDLRTELYNERAKLILNKIDLRHYSLASIRDAVDYIYFDLNLNDKK